MIKKLARRFNITNTGDSLKGRQLALSVCLFSQQNRRTQRTQPTQIDFKEYICIALDGFATLSHRL